MIVPMIILFLAAFGGGCLGWVLREWRFAEQSLLLNDAVKEGTARVYSTTRDGRSADRMPADRYADGKQ